jgi:2,4-dienoyl-CoA reductase-like NADH-dependent reductase (Old Yellow Enzyme family)/thioredoxin reductase
MMSGPRFPSLFSPLAVGPVTLKNRIFSSGHDTVLVDDGMVTDDLVAYHEARARGGAGLIVAQVAGVHETARYTSHVLMATDDSCIPGYRRLADAVHPHGCVLFGQLFHPGREIMESQDGALPVALAPSAVPNERFHVMPRAMTLDLVHEIIDGHAQAARRLKAAGLDGAELVASHGYLPAQFLNPRTNLRTDEYGGSFDNRMRFLREMATAVRREVGRDFVVGLRMSADERGHDGLVADEVLSACRALDADGVLDYISVVEGTSATLAGSVHIVPPMSEPAAYTAPASLRLKREVSVPVFVAGRINQPQEAETVIASGAADACAMTRALICDPRMPEKAATERAEEIRACIACNQACIGHFHAGYPISCIQHPETGRELRYGHRTRAQRPKDVMVVGGGPAGMKAAAVAAERGHHVTLYEAQGKVGGQVLLAERLPGRAEFGGVITNLQGEIERAGVIVKTGVRVDEGLIQQQAPDVVVVATGAQPYTPALEIDGEPTLVDAWEVIRSGGNAVPSGQVVVADWRCDWTGLGVAELLARSGRKVTLCVNGYTAGESLQQYVRTVLLASAYRAKVKIVPNVRLFGADDDTVYLQNTLTGEPLILDGISALVLAQGHRQVDDLLTRLEGGDVPCFGIGDCLAPRTVEEATLDALKISSEL